jgi:hypothetical protein
LFFVQHSIYDKNNLTKIENYGKSYEGKMAAIYDAMYQTFVDYESMLCLYPRKNCKTILEIERNR